MHLLDIWSILYYFYIYLWAIFYQFILDLPSLTLICPIGHFFRFSSIKLVSHIKMRISISGIRGCVNKNAKILNMNFRVNLSNYEGWLFVLLVLWNLHAIYRVLHKKSLEYQSRFVFIFVIFLSKWSQLKIILFEDLNFLI